MTDTPKTVFVTEYSLESGIAERFLDRICEDGSAAVMMHPASVVTKLIHPEDWHTTREAAVSRANAMRDAKIASLERQVERLKGMGFV